jgi:hypothetical protein
MRWAPAASAEVVNVATPPLRLPVPKVTPPSWNVIVPVAADGETVAVKVTLWPYTDGFSDEVRAVFVLILLTLCERTAEALPL